MSAQLKLAFAGTPELAAIVLKRIIASQRFTIATIFTQADKPAGRGRKIRESPVKQVAQEHALTLQQPANPSSLDPDDSLSDVDILVVAAYGMLLPGKILKRPRLGCINVHTSLLPRWRGAAPIQRAIQAGDKQTGISIMQMDEGLDTGNILLQKSCDIKHDETAASLHDRLAELGAKALIEALDDIETLAFKGQIQDDTRACYAAKLNKAEAEIDWSQPAISIERMIRAFNPFPVAFSNLNGYQMRIWEAEIITGDNAVAPHGSVLKSNEAYIDVITGEGILRIKTLQIAGKKKVSADEFLRGHRDFHSSC